MKRIQYKYDSKYEGVDWIQIGHIPTNTKDTRIFTYCLFRFGYKHTITINLI